MPDPSSHAPVMTGAWLELVFSLTTLILKEISKIQTLQRFKRSCNSWHMKCRNSSIQWRLTNSSNNLIIWQIISRYIAESHMTFILRIIHGESAFVVFKDLVATLTPNSPKAKNHHHIWGWGERHMGIINIIPDKLHA